MAERGEYPGPADKLTESSEWCEWEHLGQDTNGDWWSRCTVHGYDGLGGAEDLNVFGLCEGFKAPAYVEPSNPTHDLIELVTGRRPGEGKGRA